MSLFTAVELAPRDPILGLNEQFAADTNPKKVNLGVGVYFDDNGKLPLLKCVQQAENAMMQAPKARGYLPIDGIAAYDKAVQSLVFGETSESYTSGRIISRQTSDLDSIKELLDGGLNELVSGVLFGGFTFVALMLVDWQSGLVLVAMGLPLYFLMRWFYTRSQRVYRDSRVVSAKVIETSVLRRAAPCARSTPLRPEIDSSNGKPMA